MHQKMWINSPPPYSCTEWDRQTHQNGGNAIHLRSRQTWHLFNRIYLNGHRKIGCPISQVLYTDSYAVMHCCCRNVHFKFHPTVAIERFPWRRKGEISIDRWVVHIHKCRTQINVPFWKICSIEFVTRNISHIRWPIATMLHRSVPNK